MSVQYRAVGWNRQKRIIDTVALGGVALFLVLFMGVTALTDPDVTAETLIIRGTAAAALLLLHIILSIGPLARLDRRYLPLLYNRRHLGVLMFLLGLTHATFVVIQYHALGNRNPLVSLLSANREIARVSAFPFELLGIAALLILFFMASTSHDFWLSVLTPPVWKRLHMAVYLAYALLIGHVALGLMQAEGGWGLPLLLGLGLATVTGLHLAAGVRERRGDVARVPEPDGWVDVGDVGDIPEKRAVVASVGGERVAVFRYDGKLSCVSNVCRHQNGPLGEGRIIDGCITCPWHGYQYAPGNGTSPPPFTDRVPTFQVRLAGRRVLVHPSPNPPGTPVAPALIPEGSGS